MNTKELKFPIAGIFFVMSFIVKLFTLTMQYIDREYYLAGMVVLGILSVAVFTKKKKAVLIATALMLGVGIFPMFSAGRVSLLYILGIMVTLMIMIVWEMPKFGKCKPLITKVWFLPGILLLTSYFIRPILYIQYGINLFGMISEYVGGLGDFYTGIGYLFLMKWMLNPYKSENTAVNMYCGIGKHIVLYFATIGIWRFCWVYNTTKTLNSVLPNEKQQDPVVQVVLSIFVPFYSTFWLYENGKRVDSYAKEVGMKNVNTATVCLVWGIFSPFVGSCVLQSGINKICRKLFKCTY